MKSMWLTGMVLGLALVCADVTIAEDKSKAPGAELEAASLKALKQLTAGVPLAKAAAPSAHAILVFPGVKKAGLGIGGQYGEGALLKQGKAVGFYKTTGASVGLQIGAQQYGYAMFFMDDTSVGQLDAANGFEVGVGPSVVMVDEGMAKTTTTSTIKEEIVAFVFGQKGLMAGLGIQGNKITKITPD